MKSCYLFLLVLVLSVAVHGQATCNYEIQYREKTSRLHSIFNFSCTRRSCVCVKNVNTHEIYPGHEGVTRLFSSSDCTGNYQTIKEGITNGEWACQILQEAVLQIFNNSPCIGTLAEDL
ncbi:unnamed protein product [Cunninghamella echinulata]